MKCIIAGSRSITDYEIVKEAINKSGFVIDTVISGGASGVDKLGEKWAQENGVPIKQFLPDWKTYGKAAGPIRNSEMAAYAECAVICWDGISRGSKDMISKMQAADKQVFIYVPGVEK